MSPKARLVAIVCVVLVLVAGAAAWMYGRPASVPQGTVTHLEGEVRTEVVKEETDTYTIDVDYPQFGIPLVDRPIADGVAVLVDEFKSAASSTPPGIRYELFSSFDEVYVDEDIVSVRLAVSTYTGGAHPSTMIYTLNYSIRTGKEISLTSILKLVDATLEEVAAVASEELEKGLGDSFIKEGAEPRPENYWSFSISEEAVTFIFQEYQVAPYAAGPQGVAFARGDL